MNWYGPDTVRSGHGMVSNGTVTNSDPSCIVQKQRIDFFEFNMGIVLGKSLKLSAQLKLAELIFS